MLIAGLRHLRAVLDEYAAHCNRHRPHRARNLRPPDGAGVAVTAIIGLAAASIQRQKVLGGLINECKAGRVAPVCQPQSRSSEGVTDLWNPTG